MIFDIFLINITRHYDYHHPAITISFLSTCCVSACFYHTFIFWSNRTEIFHWVYSELCCRIWKINSSRGRKAARKREKKRARISMMRKKRTKLNDISVLLRRWMLSLHHIIAKKKIEITMILCVQSQYRRNDKAIISDASIGFFEPKKKTIKY